MIQLRLSEAGAKIKAGPGCDCNVHRTVEPHTKQKKKKTECFGGERSERAAAFKLKEIKSCAQQNADTRVVELKGAAGYQRDRERRGDAGRCDTVTFASTNGLAGFRRAVWC